MLTQHFPRTSLPSERRAPEGVLAPQQRVWLSRGVVALCLWRLEHILDHCNPSDLPLATLLREQIAAEEESSDSLKRLDWTLRRDADLEFCSTECDQLLSKYLPSAFGRCGEGFMDRDAALHFVEMLEAERQSFFSWILEGLSEDLPGDRLQVESDRSAERLHLVRTILLPPPQSVEPASMLSTAATPRAGAIDRRSWVLTVSGQVNRLRELQRASAPADFRKSAVTDLLRDLTQAAGDADKSDEPLARRFVREFADLRKDGSRNLEELLGVARVALAWLTGGHTKRRRLNSAEVRNPGA